MARTLIIANADFSVNKLAKVTFSDKPCTGISLNTSQVNFTSIGSSFTLVATVAPYDTTDAVVWSSSNPIAVDVVGGIITSVGCGTQIITATCGGYSATCTVVSKVVSNANTAYGYQDGIAISTSDIKLSADPPQDAASVSANSRYRCYYFNENVKSGFKAYSAYASSYAFVTNAFPIIIPDGTTEIKLSVPSNVAGCSLVLLDSQTGCTFYSSYPTRQGSLVTGLIIGTLANNTCTFNIEDFTGYDSFVFAFSVASGHASTEVTGDVTVTLS